jgi:hypothetical protein
LDIATGSTRLQRDDVTFGGMSDGGPAPADEKADDSSYTYEGQGVFFAVDRRQRNRRYLANDREYGELCETGERRSAAADLRCVHGATVAECAVCSGYARWLIASGDARIAEARRNPEASRRLFLAEMGDGCSGD